MGLPETISALRKARGLSQAELAEQLYVTRQTVSRWETVCRAAGRGEPSASGSGL